MLNAIDDASRASADPPEANTIPVAELVHTGNVGRPSIHIDPEFLAASVPLRGSSHIAALIGCSARTVRRRGLEQGLVEAGLLFILILPMRMGQPLASGLLPLAVYPIYPMMILMLSQPRSLKLFQILAGG
jgi:hypothetical protein